MEQPSQKITVKSVRRLTLDTPVPVYDATVPKYHNYCLSNGVVVHNTSRLARNADYQEIYKLTGKCPNAMRTPLPKLISNERIHDMLVALGIDVKSLDTKADSMDKMKFSTDKLRVGKIMCLADGDSDGGHITVLLLSLVYRLIPAMFTEGRVFVIDCPLYSAFYNNKRYFGDNFDAVLNQLPKGAPQSIIIRAKGLGELNPSMLRHIAFDPEHRVCIKVNPPPTADTHEYFMSIVGDNSATRKKLLGLSS